MEDIPIMMDDNLAILQCSSSSNESDKSSDLEFPIPRPLKKKRKLQDSSSNNTPLKKLASACDRTGVSDRAAALIVSSVLHDKDGCSTPNDSLIIDRSKIRRERQRYRKTLMSKDGAKRIKSVYYDGRKDPTLVKIEREGRVHKETKQKEHISLIEEPGSSYIGHIAVQKGSATSIADGIHDFLKSKDIIMDDIVAIGSDGTAVNTGSTGGVNRLLELKLNRPLHWFICQLHANELPLRNLFQKLDGKTSGPSGFSGKLGRSLEKCENLNVVNFIPVPSELPDLDLVELSTDQKYLYEMHKSISTGVCSNALVHKNPGKLAHSRWLTTANRILRLYVGTEAPSQTLVTLVQFIMKVYAPAWFLIKFQSASEYGTINLFRTIEMMRSLAPDIQEIVKPTIQRNAFYAHPENILLAMVCDERPHIRELAWRRIKKAREQEKGKTVRKFTIPQLNFDAPCYSQLISWQEVPTVTEPPLTRNISEDELEELIMTKSKKQFDTMPCHTQAVERCVKLVTEASSSVCGSESRDGFIRARIESRKKMPTFNTKNQFRT